MTDKEYIIKRLDNQIAWYSKKSSVNQKWYKWLKRFEIILSVSIPVGTMILWSCPEGKIIIAVSSAIVTLLELGRVPLNMQNTGKHIEKQLRC